MSSSSTPLEGMVAELVGIEAEIESNRRRLVKATDTLAGITRLDEVQRLKKIITRTGDLIWHLGWGNPQNYNEAQKRYRELVAMATQDVDDGQTDPYGHYQYHRKD